MASIVIDTAIKTTSLAKLDINTDEKFLSPLEVGAVVRQIEVNFVADGAVTTSIPVIIADLKKPSRILEIVLETDSTVTTAVIGITPASLPVDTDTSIQAAVIYTAGTAVRTFGDNLDVAVPSYVYWKPASGTLADTKTLRGYITYVENN